MFHGDSTNTTPIPKSGGRDTSTPRIDAYVCHAVLPFKVYAYGPR